MRKMLCIILCGVILFLNCPVGYAAEATATEALIETRATNYFNMSVSAGGKSAASETIPLNEGETVRINASYVPSDAAVLVGLIGPDGIFHYLRVTGGNVDVTIEIDEAGQYRLAVMNSSAYTVRLSGYVCY